MITGACRGRGLSYTWLRSTCRPITSLGTRFNQSSHPQLFSHHPRPSLAFEHFRNCPNRGIVTPTQAPVSSQSEHADFARYTSGRWLWDEEEQLQARFREFNVGALRDIAAKCVGSKLCTSMTKTAEGGYNKVFRLIMDDGKVVIARIPNPNAGSSFYTTASEVATMEFVSSLMTSFVCWNANLAPQLAPSVANGTVRLELLPRYQYPRSLAGITLLDLNERLTLSNLWDPDLHGSNVFIDQDRITSVIDWQGTLAGPLFLLAKASHLVSYQGEMLFKRPDNFEELDEDQKTRIKRQIFKFSLFQLYVYETKEHSPHLSEVFAMDHGKTRRLPIKFAGETWDDEIVAFRVALINVERYWDELETGVECPIHFTAEEIKGHLQDAEGCNEVQDFFDSISSLVQRDGWTHHDTFDEARGLFEELRLVGLKELKGNERESFEEETRWAEKQEQN